MIEDVTVPLYILFLVAHASSLFDIWAKDVSSKTLERGTVHASPTSYSYSLSSASLNTECFRWSCAVGNDGRKPHLLAAKVTLHQSKRCICHRHHPLAAQCDKASSAVIQSTSDTVHCPSKCCINLAWSTLSKTLEMSPLPENITSVGFRSVSLIQVWIALSTAEVMLSRSKWTSIFSLSVRTLEMSLASINLFLDVSKAGRWRDEVPFINRTPIQNFCGWHIFLFPDFSIFIKCAMTSTMFSALSDSKVDFLDFKTDSLTQGGVQVVY